MKRKTILASLILVFAGASAFGQLTVSFDFNNFGVGAAWGNLHNDSWTVSTTDAEKRSAAEGLIRAAGDYWEAAFANSTVSLSHTIAVTWGASSTALAVGGTSFIDLPPDYPMFNGSLRWDNDDSDFFVDLTPWENSEFGKSSARSDDLGGGLINVENVHYDAALGSAERNNYDMLSVAIHEVGHALGILGSYTKYANMDTGSDGDLDLVDGTELTYVDGHFTYMTTVPEPDFPFDGAGASGDYGPMAMNDTILQGMRPLLTQADILALETLHGFDNANYNPTIVPEPSGVVLAGLALSVLALRRRR